MSEKEEARKRWVKVGTEGQRTLKKKPKNLKIRCESCKADLKTIKELEEHIQTLTHKLEAMRNGINATISEFEFQMWKKGVH